MPAAVLPARSVAKQPAQKARASAAPTKKKRVVRRRGRGRGEPESDDEIEREAATDDSDSDNDDLSSNSSATDDSDTEPASEDVPAHDRIHLPTPRNSKSPESVVKDDASREAPSFFAPSGNWSEMVADEKEHGPADLPVIDFSELGNQPTQKKAPTRKPKKASKSNRAPEVHATPALPPPHEDAATNDADDTATAPKRPQRQSVSNQSARQLYQQKLETDPSFVPTIGNFWGHDDRLIDTELRSLSGWWRGRGGRGRGRGGFAIRGRGGFNGPYDRGTPGGEDGSAAKEEQLPPVERAWTHDGFEEMKRKEEQRRTEQATARQQQVSPKRGGFVAPSRGGFVPGRGRGGFVRGGFASPVRARNNSPFSPAHSNRVRFLMKPELMWTKQHEAFLYFDTTLKPRPGQGAGFRVKVPGHQLQVIRAPPGARVQPQPSTSKVTTEGSEVADTSFVVRLPKRAGKEKEVATVAEKVEKTPIEEVFTVRPELAAKPVHLPQSSTEPTNAAAHSQHTQAVPQQTIRSQLEQLSMEPQAPNPARQAKTEQAVLRKPSTDVVVEAPATDASPVVERPVLPPLQTAFTPPPPPPPPQPMSQPSPAYGSPYGYHMALPPGIAMNPHGMPYEVATGRPVYLQPPTVYNPRPMMPSHLPPGMPFVPGHMHHHSSVSAVSPDFLAGPPSHTPPVNGFIDPATGTPIFSFPRQTSRVEIRAPTSDDAGVKSIKSVPRTPSGLRTAAPTFQPSRSTGGSENGYYQQSSTPSDSALPSYDTRGHAHGHGSMEDASQAGAGMMPYPVQHYQQPYYYPEPYGYTQYVDMSQPGQYDMYSVDQPPRGTVYY